MLETFIPSKPIIIKPQMEGQEVSSKENFNTVIKNMMECKMKVQTKIAVVMS
jgi:hypothetical protein